MSDPVNHPPHYNKHPSGVECITITRHMGFNLGNAVKYIWRADLKGSSIQDLEKAIWYIQDEINKRSGVEQHGSSPGDIPSEVAGSNPASATPSTFDILYGGRSREEVMTAFDDFIDILGIRNDVGASSIKSNNYWKNKNENNND